MSNHAGCFREACMLDRTDRARSIAWGLVPWIPRMTASRTSGVWLVDCSTSQSEGLKDPPSILAEGCMEEMTRPTLDKWTASLVTTGRSPAPETLDEFKELLSDATDERPLQAYLAATPSLLATLLPPGANYWCLDRPRFGSDHVPDFLLASRSSAGFHWTMVELESPVAKVLTKVGRPAKQLAAALQQVRDWRTWLTGNVAYARDGLGLIDIDCNVPACIVIGRREALDRRQVEQYRSLSTENLTILTYDRLCDSAMANTG